MTWNINPYTPKPVSFKDKAKRAWHQHLMTLYDVSKLSDSELYMLEVYGVCPSVEFISSRSAVHRANIKRLETV